MRKLSIITSLTVACGCLVAPVGAAEAAKKSSKPSIKRVSPMRITVGKKITIRGTNFSSSRRGNTILFRASSKRSAFAKPVRASRKKLVLRIPASVENLLVSASGARKPTRLKLRVVTKRRYGKLTTLRLSPIVVSAVRKGKSADCGSGSDWDGDLLTNATELRYALDPCRTDTDSDGMTDGWEYWAAKDLNVKAVPFPSKKPYPNPLQGGDGGIDFDGDSLTSSVEYKLWRASGSAFDEGLATNGQRDSALGYSDGTQTSRPGATPAVPDFKAYPGLAPAYPDRLSMRNDGIWSDDERDADSDGLNNYIENSGPGKAGWWPAYFASAEPSVEAWPKTYYGPFNQRPFGDTDPVDPDVDGDSLLDAEDDQDNDDVHNFYEMYEPSGPHVNNGRRKNAFNPCAPDSSSRTCPPTAPL